MERHLGEILKAFLRIDGQGELDKMKYENVQKGVGDMMSGVLIKTSAGAILKETALIMVKAFLQETGVQFGSDCVLAVQTAKISLDSYVA